MTLRAETYSMFYIGDVLDVCRNETVVNTKLILFPMKFNIHGLNARFKGPFPTLRLTHSYSFSWEQALI